MTSFLSSSSSTSRRPPAFIQALFLLFGCVFVVYQMEDIAIDSLDNINRGHVRPPIIAAFSIASAAEDDDMDSDQDEFKSSTNRSAIDSKNATDTTRLWVTMGLCWSSNTKFHGKGSFPYRDAAPLSSQLWMSLTPATVILQIVYTERTVSGKLERYKEKLEGYGAIVKLVRAEGMECVLKAQIIRNFVYEISEVSPRDIVLAADVDAFIMTPKIVSPLVRRASKTVWLYRYELSLRMGYTFMMQFTSARAETWRQMLGKKEGESLDDFVGRYKKMLAYSGEYTWDLDQHIVTRAILDSGYCSVPKESKLWKEVNLEPKPVNDSATCFHGSGVYEDCNSKLWMRNFMLRYHGGNCKWWHFYPDETKVDLLAKYEEIMSGKQESGVINKIASSAKKVQKDLFGKVLLNW